MLACNVDLPPLNWPRVAGILTESPSIAHDAPMCKSFSYFALFPESAKPTSRGDIAGQACRRSRETAAFQGNMIRDMNAGCQETISCKYIIIRIRWIANYQQVCRVVSCAI